MSIAMKLKYTGKKTFESRKLNTTKKKMEKKKLKIRDTITRK